jgi:hypothetical protein
MVISIVLSACQAGTANSPTPSSVVATPRQSGAAAVPPAGPTRDPDFLAHYPEEQAVIAALTAGGMRVELIGGSKAEGILGARQRARVFIGTIDGGRTGADVLFLEAPLNVRICAAGGPTPGFATSTIFVNGRQVGGIDGTRTTSFAVSDRYFVMSTDVRVRDALQRGLGLSVPNC